MLRRKKTTGAVRALENALKEFRKIVLIASSKHRLHAVQTYITFVLVSTVLSSILPSSEYFQLRPAVHVEPVLADTPSLAEAVNL